MLIAENQMLENEGILLSHPTEGFGYQMAGAFQRLGHRLLGLINQSEEIARLKHIHMQLIELPGWRDPGQKLPENLDFTSRFTSAIFTPEPALGRNLALNEVETLRLLELARELQAKVPELHSIFVLPLSTSDESIRSFQNLGERITVFLSPAIFGFRDEALVDQALYFLKEKPGVLSESRVENSPAYEQAEFISAYDAASFIVSVPGQARFFSKTLELPTQIQGLSQWLENFKVHFKPEASFLEKFAAKISGDRLGEELAFGKRVEPRQLDSVQPALEHFPTVLSSPARVFSQMAQSFERSPELELVFPPGRSV